MLITDIISIKLSENINKLHNSATIKVAKQTNIIQKTRITTIKFISIQNIKLDDSNKTVNVFGI